MAKIKTKPKIPSTAQQIAAEIAEESTKGLASLKPEVRDVLDALLDIRADQPKEKRMSLRAIIEKMEGRFGVTIKRTTLVEYAGRRQDG